MKVLASKLAFLTTEFTAIHKRSVRFRRWQSVILLLNTYFVVFSVLYLTLIGALFQLLCVWWMYRNYLKALKWERRWLNCLNHTQRMWVNRNDETKAMFHSCQVQLELDKIKAGL